MNLSTPIKYSVLAVLVIAVGTSLHYNLPRTDVVQITGTDVKRMDRKDPQDGARTRDVRYLNAITRNGKIRVFRNEDTGWGWPPYFKFNSADLSAEAQSLIQSPERPWVRVRYYGWRIKMFSVFPNAISLKVVAKDYIHIPWFNIIFIVLFVGGIFYLVRVFQRLKDRLLGSERYREISQLVRERSSGKGGDS